MNQSRFRSPELLRLAAGQGCTLRLPGCTGGPCVSAHSNQAKHGKGRSQKADDCFVAHACDHCHREIDQGKSMTRAEKFEAWERGHIETLPRLFRGVMETSVAHKPKVKERGGSSLSSDKILKHRSPEEIAREQSVRNLAGDIDMTHIPFRKVGS